MISIFSGLKKKGFIVVWMSSRWPIHDCMLIGTCVAGCRFILWKTVWRKIGVGGSGNHPFSFLPGHWEGGGGGRGEGPQKASLPLPHGVFVSPQKKFNEKIRMSKKISTKLKHERKLMQLFLIWQNYSIVWLWKKILPIFFVLILLKHVQHFFRYQTNFFCVQIK